LGREEGVGRRYQRKAQDERVAFFGGRLRKVSAEMRAWNFTYARGEVGKEAKMQGEREGGSERMSSRPTPSLLLLPSFSLLPSLFHLLILCS